MKIELSKRQLYICYKKTSKHSNATIRDFLGEEHLQGILKEAIISEYGLDEFKKLGEEYHNIFLNNSKSNMPKPKKEKNVNNKKIDKLEKKKEYKTNFKNNDFFNI